MKNNNYVERRKHQRIPILNFVSVEYMEHTATETLKRKIDGVTKNLSLEGACVSSDKKFCPGESIKIDLTPTNGHEIIQIFGNVVSVRTVLENRLYEASVSLSFPVEEEMKKFQKYIKSMME